MKNVSQRIGNFFQRLIQMLHKTLKKRQWLAPLQQSSTLFECSQKLFVYKQQIQLNIKILRLKEFDFV